MNIASMYRGQPLILRDYGPAVVEVIFTRGRAPMTWFVDVRTDTGCTLTLEQKALDPILMAYREDYEAGLRDAPKQRWIIQRDTDAEPGGVEEFGEESLVPVGTTPIQPPDHPQQCPTNRFTWNRETARYEVVENTGSK